MEKHRDAALPLPVVALEAPVEPRVEPPVKPPIKPTGKMPVEIGGPAGPEPTRYGDWEQKGRCTDF